MLAQLLEIEHALQSQIFLTKAAYPATQCRQWRPSPTRKTGSSSRTELDQMRMLAILAIRLCILQIMTEQATPFTMGKTINTWPTLSDHRRLAKLLNFPANIDRYIILTSLARTGGKVSLYFEQIKTYSSADKNCGWRRLSLAAVWSIWLSGAF